VKQTYRGSCHCGAVRFEADAELEQVTFRCNCSFCAKSRAWFAFVPASDVRVLAGEGELVDYQFGKKRLHHFFCRTCGVRPFTRATDPKGVPMFALRVNVLDGVDAHALAALPVRYFDMLHDRADPPEGETRHL
jgi:hypothetical protein